MLYIVSKDGSTGYDTIGKAVDIAQPGDTIQVKPGRYKERLEITKPGITLTGENAENTFIENDFYANMIMDDGEKRGTFRSYTMLVFTHDFTCRNVTVANTSGFGKDVGQAIAVYAEGDNITFENCRILGHQDTLFVGPLPPKEIIPGGFKGPTQFAPRVPGKQLYKECYIEGEVDFIFGSGKAYFDNCILNSLDCGEKVNGYVAAASTYEGEKYGFIFNNCDFTGNAPEGSVYLGRPWRNFAKTVLINCRIGKHIHKDGFHDWNKKEARSTVLYVLYNCFGNIATSPDGFVRELTEDEAVEYALNKFLAE